MVKGLLFTAALALCSSAAWAQIQGPEEVRAEVNFTAGIPQGDLEDNLDDTGFGFTIFMGGRIPQSPVVLGTELGLLNYGRNEQLSIHSTVFDDDVPRDLAVPVEALNVGVSNNILLGHLVFRIQPESGLFQPYVDLLGGVKYFLTRTDVESDVIIFRHGLSQDSYVRDAAFSYGAGAGFELFLFERMSQWDERSTKMSLHAGVRYLFGTEARYVRDEPISEVDGRFLFNVQESRTDMIVPHFGVRVRH